jgi:N-acetylglucosaminyldiphosphoundecaprenol N-acetyl-beta-D-mannosaminyltransferase
MAPIPRFNVLGVGISALDLTAARDAVRAALAERRKGYVCTVDARVVNLAAGDPALRARLNASFLNTPDGMPLAWLGRWQGNRAVGRVYGPDLMLAICEVTAVTGYTHFFYGGAPGVAENLRLVLMRRFPGLRIVGVKTPPFRPLTATEEAGLVSEIAVLRPDVFWVGLSVPERERFMAALLPRLDTTVMIGVGAAFDLLSGRIPQAPRWMQRSGLEWLFRLAVEPRRLWRRYLVNNPLFVARVLLQVTGLRRYPLD